MKCQAQTVAAAPLSSTVRYREWALLAGSSVIFEAAGDFTLPSEC